MVENKNSSFSSPPASVQAKRQLDDAKRFLATGKISEAQDASRDLLGAHPEYVEALSTLGQAYLAEQKYDAALPCFIRASMLSENDPAILFHLAELYFQLGSDDMAAKTGEQVLELSSDREDVGAAHLLLGRVYWRQSDYEKAITHLIKAKSSSGDSSQDATLLLGSCCLEISDTEQAVGAFSTALKAGLAVSDEAEVLYALSRISGAGAAKKLLSKTDALENEAQSEGADGDDSRESAYLGFARAELLDRAGQYQDAWQALETVNADLGAAYSGVVRQLREADEFTIQRASEWMYAGPPMVEINEDVPDSLMILGPSRSGKTTLERLAGCLKGVARGYEHELVQMSAREAATLNGFLPLMYPGQLPISIHRQFTRIYARQATQRARGASVLTCTHPGLIPDLGRIAETVPNLKVIFVDRDMTDNALRIFGKMYPENTNPFAYEVAAIYGHLEGYQRLVGTWSRVLGDICMRVSYEDMVADPKAMLKSIAEFTDLDASKAKVPDIGDDRDCAKPYLEFLERARSGAIAPLSGWAVPEL